MNTNSSLFPLLGPTGPVLNGLLEMLPNLRIRKLQEHPGVMCFTPSFTAGKPEPQRELAGLSGAYPAISSLCVSLSLSHGFLKPVSWNDSFYLGNICYSLSTLWAKDRNIGDEAEIPAILRPRELR